MMKKVKVVLAVLGSILVIVLVLGVVASTYLKNTFLDFEEGYTELATVQEIQQDGHSFLDLNANERLDVYEDERIPIEKRVSNLLSLMTLEEKIHLLKGSGIGSAIGLNEPGLGIPGAVGTLVATPRLGIPTRLFVRWPCRLANRTQAKRRRSNLQQYRISNCNFTGVYLEPRIGLCCR